MRTNCVRHVARRIPRIPPTLRRYRRSRYDGPVAAQKSMHSFSARIFRHQISALKTEKRQRDQQRKQKITENRKHLANVRVVQKNLVFVVGLPPRLSETEILKKHEYFGKYGKIHKVVINPSTTYAGVQVCRGRLRSTPLCFRR